MTRIVNIVLMTVWTGWVLFCLLVMLTPDQFVPTVAAAVKNLFVYMTYVLGAMSTAVLLARRSHDDMRKRFEQSPIPRPFSQVLALTVTVILAAEGQFWLATIWLWTLVVERFILEKSTEPTAPLQK